MKEVEQMVKSCPVCMKNKTPHTEPLLYIRPALPSHPWEKVAANLFQLKGKPYLVVVDYYSKYVKMHHYP